MSMFISIYMLKIKTLTFKKMISKIFINYTLIITTNI
jgi:hypothetical protein